LWRSSGHRVSEVLGCSDDVFDAGAKAAVVKEFAATANAWARGAESVPASELLRPWTPEDLRHFPLRRGRCLHPRPRVADLPPLLRARTWVYLRQLNPHPPSLASIFAHIDGTRGRHRIGMKEVFESCEVASLLVRWISQRRSVGVRIDRVVEAACGHGLVGMLLAHCLLGTPVVGIDLVERPSTRVARAAWERWGRPLDNFRCLQGDARDAADLDGHSLVVAVHACNEATLDVLDMARAAGSLWSVMPCCMPRRLYLPGCGASVRHEDRYPLLCGVLAGQHGAELIKGISPTITDKNLLLVGRCPPAGAAAGGT